MPELEGRGKKTAKNLRPVWATEWVSGQVGQQRPYQRETETERMKGEGGTEKGREGGKEERGRGRMNRKERKGKEMF